LLYLSLKNVNKDRDDVVYGAIITTMDQTH